MWFSCNFLIIINDQSMIIYDNNHYRKINKIDIKWLRLIKYQILSIFFSPTNCSDRLNFLNNLGFQINTISAQKNNDILFNEIKLRVLILAHFHSDFHI